MPKNKVKIDTTNYSVLPESIPHEIIKIKLELQDFAKIAKKPENKTYLFKTQLPKMSANEETVIASENLFVADVNTRMMFWTSYDLFSDVEMAKDNVYFMGNDKKKKK